jgi:Fe-Mn family superoxide dismutase
MSEHESTNMNRRRFLGLAAAGALLATTPAGALAAHGRRGFPMPPLPYAENALAPHISARTVSFHYGKHTAGYYDKFERFTAGTDYAGMPPFRVSRLTDDKPGLDNVFNNAAQAWNHTFYWQGLTPRGGGMPTGRIAAAIRQSFGGWGACRDRFIDEAGSVFGSGWAWLVQYSDRRLGILTTKDAGNPLTTPGRPLLTVDVWEHAYYLDYQNRRSDYVAAVLDNLVNWDFVNRNMG